MAEKITSGMMDDEREEEKQPLNAMVAKNLKEIVIKKIYTKDVETSAEGRRRGLSPVLRQYITGCATSLSQLSCGMAVGFSAVLLPQLVAEDSEIPITNEEGSWIASLLALPLMFGCLFSGHILHFLGRKKSVCLSAAGLGIGWFVLALAPNVPALYAGRFITGFCMSLNSPPSQVYIAETAQPEHRGILLSTPILAIAVGILMSHVLGTFLAWRTSSWLCAIPVVVCILVLYFVKESPVWLLQKGRANEAEEAFVWYRGNSENAMKEFRGLQSLEQRAHKNESESLKTKLKKCLKPSFIKPFMILNFFFFVQQFSGINGVTFYSIHILKKVMTNMNEYFSTFLIDVVRAVASVVSIVLLKKFGRKQLAVISALGTSVSLFLLTFYLGFMNSDAGDPLGPGSNHSLSLIVSNETWTADDAISASEHTDITGYFPLVFLILYIFFISIGLVPLPWVVTGELFSKEMRELGNGVTTAFAFLYFFLVVKTTPQLFENLKDYGTFCLFGVIALVGGVLLWFFLPETKDKTLLEIEAYFDKKVRVFMESN